MAEQETEPTQTQAAPDQAETPAEQHEGSLELQAMTIIVDGKPMTLDQAHAHRTAKRAEAQAHEDEAGAAMKAELEETHQQRLDAAAAQADTTPELKRGDEGYTAWSDQDVEEMASNVSADDVHDALQDADDTLWELNTAHPDVARAQAEASPAEATQAGPL
jgi:hypothetical protein